MRHTYEYAVLRVVPRVERGELVNAGVVLYSQGADFLDARLYVDAQRLHALDAALDIDAVRGHLEAVRAVCRGSADAGPAGQGPLGERFRWLTAPRSTVVQPSPVHTGTSSDLDATLDRLLKQLVLPAGSMIGDDRDR